jgi:hypothetical protein
VGKEENQAERERERYKRTERQIQRKEEGPNGHVEKRTG